jgi:hypothetical protein
MATAAENTVIDPALLEVDDAVCMVVLYRNHRKSHALSISDVATTGERYFVKSKPRNYKTNC